MSNFAAQMKTIVLTSTTRMYTPAAATIGCFDGVHRGHQKVIRLLTSEAARRGLAAMVITFDRQPRQLFDESYCPQLLSTLQEKASYIEALGVDLLVVLPFTSELASLSAEAFMRHILRDQLQVKLLLTGYDNRFGRDRSEGYDDYTRYGHQLGIELLRGDVEMMDDQVAVSSTVIRQLLADEGSVEQMPFQLTRLYELSGNVVKGEHIGHSLGFPTANLEPEDAHKLIPANGVYAVWASLDGNEERLPAMMNIGMRPTFGGHRRTLEVHVLKMLGDIYGRRLTVSFVARLRAECRFDSREQLIEQLRQDRMAAEKALGCI